MYIYGKTTVEQRVIPDFRDGLKPVHRRILYSMFDKSIFPGKSLKKSAAVVGDTMARFHPHSDMSIFNTLVNLVQNRYPLVFGLGNWGDLYSPSASARYIDCRLSELAMRLFEYMPIADYEYNYSGEFKEPVVIPSEIPNILMNGSSGVAVGVSVNIPTHNLKELVDVFVILIDNPDATLSDIVKILRGPDTILGGVLLSTNKEVEDMYASGDGSLRYRCQYRFKETDTEKTPVMEIYNFAPGFNKDKFIGKCENLVKNGLLEYISDDSADGIFKLSVGYISAKITKQKVIPWLHSSVSYHFYVTERLSSENVTFRKTNLLDLMNDWLEYQREIKADYLIYLKEEVQEELIKQKARYTATKNIQVVADSLKYKKPEVYLMSKLQVSKKSAQYILECRVGGLAKLSLKNQVEKIKKLLKDLKTIDIRRKNVDTEIKSDLLALAPFFDARRTLIRESAPKIVSSGHLWISLHEDSVKKNVNSAKVKNPLNVCTSENGFVTIDEAGTCLYWKDGEDKTLYPNTFEIVSGDYTYLAAVDDRGNCAIIDLSGRVSRKKEFVVLKTKTKVIGAVGFNDGDKLIISDYRKDKITVLNVPEDIKVVKTSTKGTKILRNRTKKILIQTLSSTDTLVTDTGEIVDIDDEDTLKKWYVVGEHNLIKTKDKAYIADTDSTLDAIKKGNFLTINKIR